MKLTVKYPFGPKSRSLGTSLVMDTFGVGFDQGEHVVAENVELDVRPGQIVLFTGPSGSGKSSLLRAVARELESAGGQRLIFLDQRELPERALVDGLGLPIRDAVELLGACGLGEARLFLRLPSELSDGQRYRYRLAVGLARLRAECATRSEASTQSEASAQRITRAQWLVGDEFTSGLDRTVAQVVAYNLGRLARRFGIGCLLATANEEVGVDLSPDVWVRADWDGVVAVEQVRGDAEETPHAQAHSPGGRGGQTRRISFFRRVGMVRAPVPTGPTLPLGIIEAIPSGRFDELPSCGTRIGRSGSVCSLPRHEACDCETNTSGCGTRVIRCSSRCSTRNCGCSRESSSIPPTAERDWPGRSSARVAKPARRRGSKR